MRRPHVAAALLVASTLPLLGLACKKDVATEAATRGGRGGGRGMAGEGGLISFAADVLKLEPVKMQYVVTAPGTIDAFERVQVTARVAGVVDRVSFREGQEVKKGDTLVIIDSERFGLAVNSAKANLEKAQAAQKDTEAMVERREGASAQNPGLIPGEELASYRTKSLTAKADTAVALENLKIAQLNMRDSAVRAPMEGIIQTRTVETGQYVNTGYVMATLLRNDPMLLRFQVEPSEAPRIKVGMTASFTLRETQRAYTAKISLVSGSADATSHMVGITATIDDDKGKYWLRPGSFCDVSVDVGGTRESVVIPRTATRATDHGYVVYVAKDDVVEERVITLGMSSKTGSVEVRTGLRPGELIVVRGAEALTSGARIRATVVTSVDGGAPSVPDDEVDAGARAGLGDGGGGGGARRRRDGDGKEPTE